MDVWNAASGNRMPFRIATSDYNGLFVARLPEPWGLGDGSIADVRSNGAVQLDAQVDGAVAIRSATSRAVVGHLRVLQDGDWLVTTPSGLFDGSRAGWRQLAWRIQGELEVAPAELFFNEFYQPGLLADLFGGRTPRSVRNIAERDRRQPTIALSEPTVEAGHARLRLTVTEAPASDDYVTGSGVRDVRLFRNGTLVNAWRGQLSLAGGTVRMETRVPLVAGENRLVAYAFNSDNVKSSDAEVSVSHDAPDRQASVYVFAIGVNEYTNRDFDLRYAVPDATAFAGEFARRQQQLGATRVRMVTLLNGDATRSNILLGLARLSGRHEGPLPVGAPVALAALERVRPEDTVAVYFGGHGVATDDRFHLIPTDIPYTGPRVGVRAALPEVHGRSISDIDLEQAFEPMDARHVLLFIDACQSGQALESEDPRFGPMNSRGLAQLAYEKGMSILTASQAYQTALESAQVGHGYLTYALVEEGLKSAAADRSPRDGMVTVNEWFDYAVGRVPEIQIEAVRRITAGQRELTFEAGVSLQMPRVFTRRDPVASALIVARP